MPQLPFEPRNPHFEVDVRRSFARQQIMTSCGASLTRLEPGLVEITLPFSVRLTQQDGFLHAGIIAAIADSACGYAAMTLAPTGTGVLTAEFKVNFLAPGQGDGFLASGRVIRAGRTLTVCRGDVHTTDDDVSRRMIATMLATVVSRVPRE